MVDSVIAGEIVSRVRRISIHKWKVTRLDPWILLTWRDRTEFMTLNAIENEVMSILKYLTGAVHDVSHAIPN